MAAGIDHAQGSVIVTMDGDLQNDPRDIATLVERLDEGYDIAVGWRHNRQDKLVTRKIPSRIANWIIGRITGVPIKDNGCSLKAYRAEVIKRIPLYSDMHRFIPAMASLAGTRVSEVKVRHHARQFGESKYGLGRIYKVLVDLLSVKTIVAFSSRPMLWFTLLSLPFAVASGACILISILALASGGRMSLPIAGSGVLLGGLAFFLVLNGALAELVYKTGDVRVDSLANLTMSIK
jgi:glycosyltransferase involved in cell wall biosynthesis